MTIQQNDYITSAKRVIDIEARAINHLAQRLDESFVTACEMLYACSGKVVVSGMGKSGHIGNKIAATLASTSHSTGRRNDTGTLASKARG